MCSSFFSANRRIVLPMIESRKTTAESKDAQPQRTSLRETDGRTTASCSPPAFLASECQKLICSRPPKVPFRYGSLFAGEHMPGKHLVFVRYGEGHNIDREWVFNDGDIDASKIVWAREMSPEQNAKLLAYYPDRQVWLVEPEQNPDRLISYLSAKPSK